MFATSHLQKDHGSEGGSSVSISLDDVEKLQAVYPDYRIELREGKLIVMSPSDSASGEIGARFIRLLVSFVRINGAFPP